MQHCFTFVSFGYSPSRTPGVNNEGNAALKRPDTNESLNSSMSNGTTDAGIQTNTHMAKNKLQFSVPFLMLDLENI